VSDDGAGFNPTATLYDRNHPHTGLGLFSIQERLALLGGHLDIVSAPGKGSRFTLTLARTGLPRLTTDSTETSRRDTDRQQRPVYIPARGTSKSLRILIADDHAVVRAGLRELFSERRELRVVGEAANGVEVISQAKALQPDVILMDVAMPQKNGIEVTQEIHDALPHIQIVGLSTFRDQTTERAMREAGAQAYFSKTESTHRLFDYVLSLRPQAKGLREFDPSTWSAWFETADPTLPGGCSVGSPHTVRRCARTSRRIKQFFAPSGLRVPHCMEECCNSQGEALQSQRCW
jgi:CheY-like chemotaxis protein